MAKKKKITRKQLLNEPDEFITFSSKLLKLIMDYKNHITVALCVIFSILIVFTAWRYFSNKAEDKAFALLDQGVTKYEKIKVKNGESKAYLEVEKDFKSIFEKYSRKDGGKLARVTYANICYNAGKPDKAITLYNQSLRDFDDKPFINNIILNSLGYAHEKKGDYPGAIKYFEMIISSKQPDLKDEALFNLGRLYSKVGDEDKSLEAFKKIVSDYTDSIYFNIVKEKLAG